MNAAVEVEVSLAELQKAAEWSEDLQAPLHSLAAERIEHNVDTLTARDLAHGVRKREVAGIEDVIRTGKAQKRSLDLRAGRGYHDRVALLGILDRREPDTAGSGVD